MSKKGRPAGRQSGEIGQRNLDALLHSWLSGETRHFKDINTSLKKRGIVKHDFQTIRILTRASKLGFIEKVSRGTYKSNVEPEEFRVFDYLQTLREKNHDMARGQIGGALWSSHDMYFLGMPDQVFDDREGNYALQILNVRLAELFNAYRALAEVMNARKERHDEGQPSGLPQTVIRQLLLELTPYYLGSRAGIDGDGLSMDELNDALTTIIQALPEKIDVDKGWPASTLKDSILENFGYINALNLIYIRNKEKTRKTTDQLTERLKEDIEETTMGNDTDFALIVTGPEHLIDSQGFTQRTIKDEIIEHGNEDESPFYLAHLLLGQKREDVLKALSTCGRKYLGPERCKRARDAYDKLYAANWLAKVMSTSDERAFFKEGPFDKKEKSEIDKTMNQITQSFGIKELITYLPFSKSPLIFQGPTPEKEKLIQKFFPQVPAENIHEWLSEGSTLASNIFERSLEKAKEKWDDSKNPAVQRTAK